MRRVPYIFSPLLLGALTSSEACLPVCHSDKPLLHPSSPLLPFPIQPSSTWLCLSTEVALAKAPVNSVLLCVRNISVFYPGGAWMGSSALGPLCCALKIAPCPSLCHMQSPLGTLRVRLLVPFSLFH
jgi:hypothetical protein